MKIVFSLLLIFLTLVSRAQHQHNMPSMSDSSMKKMTMKKSTSHKTPRKKNVSMNMNRGHKPMPGDSTKPAMKMDMDHNVSKGQTGDTMKHEMNMEGMNMNMTHSFSRNLPMSRDGSGTSWMPDATPMYMYMSMKDKSMIMLHGNIFLRYTKQDLFNKGSRGGHHFDAPNWFMAMYDRYIGKKGLFSATA